MWIKTYLLVYMRCISTWLLGSKNSRSVQIKCVLGFDSVRKLQPGCWTHQWRVCRRYYCCSEFLDSLLWLTSIWRKRPLSSLPPSLPWPPSSLLYPTLPPAFFTPPCSDLPLFFQLCLPFFLIHRWRPRFFGFMLWWMFVSRLRSLLCPSSPPLTTSSCPLVSPPSLSSGKLLVFFLSAFPSNFVRELDTAEESPPVLYHHEDRLL